MPDKKGRFTDQERAFVDAYVSTGDAITAAKLAGYKSPQVSAWQKLHTPAVVAEIQRHSYVRIHAEGVPAALDHLISLAKDEKAAPKDRTQAASVILRHAKGDIGGAGAKELHEMSPDELDQAIQRIRAEMAARARPIIEGTATELEPDDVFA